MGIVCAKSNAKLKSSPKRRASTGSRHHEQESNGITALSAESESGRGGTRGGIGRRSSAWSSGSSERRERFGVWDLGLRERAEEEEETDERDSRRGREIRGKWKTGLGRGQSRPHPMYVAGAARPTVLLEVVTHLHHLSQRASPSPTRVDCKARIRPSHSPRACRRS